MSEKNSKKMGFGDTIKFIITGKKPEKFSQETSEEIDGIEEAKEEREESINTSKKNSEKKSASNRAKKHFEKFEKEVGMSLEKAKTLISTWKKNGEDEKVKKGESLIKKYFPKNKEQQVLEKKIDEIEKQEEVEKIQRKKNVFSENKVVKNPLSAIGISYSREKDLPDENEIDDRERVFAGISYIPFFSIFVIFTQKDSPFAQYHAWQGFAFLVLQIAITTFGFFFGMLGLGFLFSISNFLLFIFLVFSGFTAFQGRYISVPFITPFAKTLSGRD